MTVLLDNRCIAPIRPHDGLVSLLFTLPSQTYIPSFFTKNVHPAKVSERRCHTAGTPCLIPEVCPSFLLLSPPLVQYNLALDSLASLIHVHV